MHAQQGVFPQATLVYYYGKDKLPKSTEYGQVWLS